MLIGKQFTERLYSENQEEKLYSTGDEMLDNLLERAFCEGYELAQREYAEEAEKGALVVIPSKQIVKRSGSKSKIADFLRNNKKALIIGTSGAALAGGGAYLLHKRNKKKKEEEDKRKKSN